MTDLAYIFKKAGKADPAVIGNALGEFLEIREAEAAKSEIALFPVLDAYNKISLYFDLPFGHPLDNLAREIAAYIDYDVPATEGCTFSGCGNGYHNKNHMLEVMVSAATLLAIHNEKDYKPALSKEDQLLFITAALAHDIGHNGKGNGMGQDRVPLLTEKHSLELIKPIMQRAYTDSGQADKFDQAFQRMTVLLYATDIGGGDKAPGRFFSELRKFQCGEIAEKPKAPLPELKALIPGQLKKHSTLLEMCCMLQDADLLTSIGLCEEWAEKQSARMAQENPACQSNGGKVNWGGEKWFHDNMAQLSSLAGRHFLANFERIKAHIAAKAAAQELAL